MKIVVRDFMDMHPKHIHCASDYYYVRVANELNQVIRFVTKGGVEEDILADVALKLALYLEDVVSEAGIWDTFVELHRRMYDRPLPFYDVHAGYSASDMTEENVSFLIWLFMMNGYEGQRILNPDNPGMHEMAKAVLPVLQKYRKKAPVNEDLLDLLYGDETLEDFMEVKHVLMWLSDQCYLSEWVGTMVLVNDLVDKLEESFPSMSYGKREYMARSIYAFAHKGTLLAMLPQQWYAEMLRGYNADEFAGIARDIEDIAFRNFGVYHVEGCDDVHIRLTDTEGKPLQLRRDSVDSGFSSKSLDTHKVLLTAMAQWKSEWQMVGMSSWLQDERVYHDAVEELHAPKDNLTVLPPELIGKLGGRRLFFFKDYAALHSWTNELLGTACAETDKGHLREMKDILVFIEDNGAMSITPDGACGVKAADNPLYSPAKAPTEALRLLLSTESTTAGMSRYLVENGLLADACLNSMVSPERGRQLVQENMDFLARCLRRCSY